MADLYSNFSYCLLTADVDNSTTTFPVDDTTRIPSNALLAANDFYMTAENLSAGNLGPTSTFEVVKVTAKSVASGPGNLTVLRNQEGSGASPHAANSFLKAGITAGMLSRVANPQRQTATYTTAALAAGAMEQGVVALAVGFRILHIATSAPARVRLYSTAAARTADLARSASTDRNEGVGLILDYLTAASLLAADLSPLADGYSGEAIPSVNIPITVTAVSAGSITCTLTWIRTE